MKSIKYLLLFFFINISYSQFFEGRITFKTTVKNPNPDLLSAVDFRRKVVEPAFGKQGFMMQQFFYQKDRFIAIKILNFESSFELYSPKSKKLYQWKKDAKKGSFINVNENDIDDKLVNVIETKEVATILNIKCKKVIFEFKKIGKVEIWYNPDCLMVNKENYKDYKYDFKDVFTDKLGAFPFRVKLGFIVTEIIKYEEEPISDNIFQLPPIKFETVPKKN